MVFDDDFLSGMVGGMFGNALADSFQEYQVNSKRPGIEGLSFTEVSAERAEEVRRAKTGFFGGGTKKKLAASIEEGRTAFAEVLAVARTYKSIERDSDKDPQFDRREYYYKIADLDGNVLREDVPALAQNFVVSFEFNGGDSASVTGNADKVDPAGYLHMFLLRYYLKDDEYYVLLTRDQFEDLATLVPYAGSIWHYAEDGVGYSW